MLNMIRPPFFSTFGNYFIISVKYLKNAVGNQRAVLFSHNKSLCSFSLLSNQPAVLFSHTKSAPATSYQPVSSTVLS